MSSCAIGSFDTEPSIFSWVAVRRTTILRWLSLILDIYSVNCHYARFREDACCKSLEMRLFTAYLRGKSILSLYLTDSVWPSFFVCISTHRDLLSQFAISISSRRWTGSSLWSGLLWEWANFVHNYATNAYIDFQLSYSDSLHHWEPSWYYVPAAAASA